MVDGAGGFLTAFKVAMSVGKGEGGSKGEPAPVNSQQPGAGEYEESIFGARYVSPDGTTYHGEAAKQAYAEENGAFNDEITGEGLDANKYAGGGGQSQRGGWGRGRGW